MNSESKRPSRADSAAEETGAAPVRPGETDEAGNPAPHDEAVPSAATLQRLHDRELQGILHISNMVGSVMELDRILAEIATTTADVMDTPVCSIFLFDDEEEGLLRLRATHGLNPEVVGRVTFDVGQGIPGWVAEHGESVVLSDAPADPRFSPIAGSNEEDYLAAICSPLYIQTELIGVMQARKRGVYDFSPGEVTLFETICKQVAIVIEKSRMHFQMIETERLAAIGLSLSEISHYIKNVLQSIKGGAYFIDSGVRRRDLKRVENGWNTLKRGNRKITSLVENMLSYSRQSSPRLEEVMLDEMLLEILTSTEETARRRNVFFEPEIEERLPPILADYESLNNAILNLVTNALDALEEQGGGTVRLSLTRDREAEHLVLTVSDDGPGIPPEVMKNIFHLFFSTKGQRGTGIGLAVTRKIIQEAGGSIRVSSEPGEGATFECRFPIPVTQLGGAAASSGDE